MSSNFVPWRKDKAVVYITTVPHTKMSVAVSVKIYEEWELSEGASPRPYHMMVRTYENAADPIDYDRVVLNTIYREFVPAQIIFVIAQLVRQQMGTATWQLYYWGDFYRDIKAQLDKKADFVNMMTASCFSRGMV